MPDAAGMFVLAMGKMGAGELNYSSDIDLIVLFDETRHDPADYAELRRGFIRVTQRMVKLLSEVTGEGYVFRTDLRLRPDPSVTPVCIATEPAEHYYESLGRTWERAAYIKARPCAGAIAAGWHSSSGSARSSGAGTWTSPRSRTPTTCASASASTRASPGRSHVPGHDLKLGQGGIREIEFFTQTRQLIVGGRDAGPAPARDPATPSPRWPSSGWVEPRHRRRRLHDAYVAHRDARAPAADARRRPDPAPAREPRRARPARRLLRRRSPTPSWPSSARRLETVQALTEPFFVPGSAARRRRRPPEAIFADPEAAPRASPPGRGCRRSAASAPAPSSAGSSRAPAPARRGRQPRRRAAPRSTPSCRACRRACSSSR